MPSTLHSVTLYANVTQCDPVDSGWVWKEGFKLSPGTGSAACLGAQTSYSVSSREPLFP